MELERVWEENEDGVAADPAHVRKISTSCDTFHIPAK